LRCPIKLHMFQLTINWLKNQIHTCWLFEKQKHFKDKLLPTKATFWLTLHFYSFQLRLWWTWKKPKYIFGRKQRDICFSIWNLNLEMTHGSWFWAKLTFSFINQICIHLEIKKWLYCLIKSHLKQLFIVVFFTNQWIK
jgi:hypothetical protein